jgi:hypothetical protein
MGIHRSFDGSTPNVSEPPFRGQKIESKKMDTTRIISLAGLSMIFFWVYLSIRRNRNMPRRHGAERLFEAFKEEIQGLQDGQADAHEILQKALPRHENAYLHFRPHLNGRILRQFDEAWREYSCGREENSPPSLEQYFGGGNQTLAQERRQLALRRILRFLSSVRMYSHLPPR